MKVKEKRQSKQGRTQKRMSESVSEKTALGPRAGK